MIRIQRAGACSTLQDLGRPHWQQFGVSWGGAADRQAHQLANLLVGNEFDCATIEMTLIGDTIEVEADAVMAWTGADLNPQVEYRGNVTVFPRQRPVLLRAGCRLLSGSAIEGCRAYLAVAGGFEVPSILGSRATDLRGGFGGWQGRTLRAGDLLPIGKPDALAKTIHHNLSAGLGPLTGFSSVPWFHMENETSSHFHSLRMLVGQHASFLVAAEQLYQNSYTVSSRTDRMGCRLTGPALKLATPLELPSGGLVPGTLQLPPDGQPILIMADGAPTGGYPQIGYLISADMSLMAQKRPGDLIDFEQVSLETAQLAYRRQTSHLKAIGNSIRLWARLP